MFCTGLKVREKYTSLNSLDIGTKHGERPLSPMLTISKKHNLLQKSEKEMIKQQRMNH